MAALCKLNHGVENIDGVSVSERRLLRAEEEAKMTKSSKI